MPIRAPTRLSLPLSIVLALAIAPAPLDAQGEPSTLTVFVRVEGGPALMGAQVVVEGLGIGTITDGSGVARLRELPPGAKTVSVRHLGYAPMDALVTLEGGRASTLSFSLVPKPIELAEVRVTAWASPLLRNGFYERRSGGAGTFFTRQEIVQMRARLMSDIMRRVAGARVQSSPVGANSRAAMRGQRPGACPIQFYLDGALTGITNIDEIRADDVAGIEIYRGASTVPPAYNKGTARCGVVLVWTRVE